MASSPTNLSDTASLPEGLASPPSPLAEYYSPRSHRSIISLDSLDYPMYVSSESHDSESDDNNISCVSPITRSTLTVACANPPLAPLSPTRRFMAERERLHAESKKFIAENVPLRDRLRKAKFKVPLSMDEFMYDESKDSLAVLRGACHRLEEENSRMALRSKRLDWFVNNLDFPGTSGQIDDVLCGLELLSPYELCDDGEEPDEPS